MSKELGNTENPIENVQSHDWNKERLEQLKTLMPDLFTNDGQLNINELKKVVDPNLVTETERYEFRWFGKSNAKREAFTPTDSTLVYDEDRSVNPTKSENLIIEGENLAVLKLLSNSYRGQVKCIYIDPPYNTGNDFVYSDKFNQDKKEYWEDSEITENGFKIDTNTETDGRFHSNWLNMMYSRLLIARQLLKEDGVIFISIDDNEVHHLRKLCDEVFGEENFVDCLKWKRKKQPSFLAKHTARIMEYVLVYGKNSEQLEKLSIEGTSDSTKKVVNLTNHYSERIFPKGVVVKVGEKGIINKGKYLIKSMTIEYLDDVVFENGKSINEVRVYAQFSVSQEKIDNYVDEGLLFITKNKGLRRDVSEDEIGKRKSITDLLLDWGDNQDSDIEMRNLFDQSYFDYTKPTKLLSNLFKSIYCEDSIILDFFAGSGTTGQAVTELSQEDGGNRKYILVQLPEATDKTSEAYKAGYKKISDITIERNKRVVERIIKEKKKAQPDLFSKKEDEQNQLKGLGFKVFKLQKSNFPRVEYAPDPNKTHEENIEALKKYIRDKEAQLISAFNKEEIITEILLKNGFKLNYMLTKQEQFTKNEILFATDGDKETLVCLDGDLAEETVETSRKTRGKNSLC